MTSNSVVAPEQGNLELGGADFEGGPIVGRVKLTTEDLASVWAALPGNRPVIVQRVLTVVALPLFWLMFSMFGSSGTGAPDGMTWFVVVQSLVLPPALGFRLWRTRAQWAKNGVADLGGAEGVEFRFDSAGVSFNPRGSRVQHAWSSLFRCLETAHAFLIYVSPSGLIVVPKRAFTAADQARLRARLLELVPNRPLRGTNIWRPLRSTLTDWVMIGLAFFGMWQFLDKK